MENNYFTSGSNVKRMSYLKPEVKKNKTRVYKCMCSTLKMFFYFTKWTVILPMESYGITTNHFKTGCKFRVWKNRYWLLSIYLVSVLLFGAWIIHSYASIPKEKFSILIYIQMMTYLIYNGEMYCYLFFNNFYADRLAKLYERLSLLPSNQKSLESVYRKLFLLLSLEEILLLVTGLLWVVAYYSGYPMFTLINFVGCVLGFMLIVVMKTFAFAQNIVVCSLSLLIITKFEALAEATQQYLDQAIHCWGNNQAKILLLDNQNTQNLTKKRTLNLEELHIHMCEIHKCLEETNKCMGFQVLYSLCFMLMNIIYSIFRKATSFKYHTAGIFLEVHLFLVLSGCILILALFVTLGHWVKFKGNKPLKVLQNAKVLHLPMFEQMQIQTLLQQWATLEPPHLSAFNVIQLGPWLIAPVFSNVLTYLLVIIQYDNV